MAIYFARMNNDQSGECKRDPRYIYANPIDPIVCPLTALEMYLNTFGQTGTKLTSLFSGNQSIRYVCQDIESFFVRHRETIEK